MTSFKETSAGSREHFLSYGSKLTGSCSSKENRGCRMKVKKTQLPADDLKDRFINQHQVQTRVLSFGCLGDRWLYSRAEPCTDRWGPIRPPAASPPDSTVPERRAAVRSSQDSVYLRFWAQRGSWLHAWTGGGERVQVLIKTKTRRRRRDRVWVSVQVKSSGTKPLKAQPSQRHTDQSSFNVSKSVQLWWV